MSVERKIGLSALQPPENSITTAKSISPLPNSNQFFEDLLHFQALYRLRERYSALPQEDRFTPFVGAQTDSKGNTSIIVTTQQNSIHTESSEEHLALVRKRQKEFDRDIGFERKPGQFLAYDPVFDRVNFELASTPTQIQAVKTDIERELVTSLRERYHTAQSQVEYILDENGVAYSQDDRKEPVDLKFLRGAQYRIENGSPEPEREWKTVQAGMEAKRKLAESAEPLIAIVVSPPSSASGSIYHDNFVDIYETDKDAKGRKIIRMSRFASSLTEEEYKVVLEGLKQGFFEGKKGPFDVQCLEPIFLSSYGQTVQEIFNQHFKPQEQITSEEDFQEILARNAALRENYLNRVFESVYTPSAIALAINAVINQADHVRNEIIQRARGFIKKITQFGPKMVEGAQSVREQETYWGKKAVMPVMAACGISQGFSLGTSALTVVMEAAAGLVSRILGVFSKDFCIRCGACGEKIWRVIRRGERCPRPKCSAVRQC